MGKIFTSEEALANPPSFWDVANPEWLQTLKEGDTVGCVYRTRYSQFIYVSEKVTRRSPKRITIGTTVINIENGHGPKSADSFRRQLHYLPYDDHFKRLIVMFRKAAKADLFFSGLEKKFKKLPNEAKVQIADKIRAIAVEFGVVFEDKQS